MKGPKVAKYVDQVVMKMWAFEQYKELGPLKELQWGYGDGLQAVRM